MKKNANYFLIILTLFAFAVSCSNSSTSEEKENVESTLTPLHEDLRRELVNKHTDLLIELKENEAYLNSQMQNPNLSKKKAIDGFTKRLEVFNNKLEEWKTNLETGTDLKSLSEIEGITQEEINKRITENLRNSEKELMNLRARLKILTDSRENVFE